MRKDRYLTIRQVSVLLGLKVRTVRYWISTGKLKAKKSHNMWFISEKEVYSKEIQEHANKGRRHSERIKEGKEMGMLHGAGQDTEESV